jgi:hypothetical protein
MSSPLDPEFGEEPLIKGIQGAVIGYGLAGEA